MNNNLLQLQVFRRALSRSEGRNDTSELTLLPLALRRIAE